MSKKTIRTTVVLPADTAEKLRELVPKRKRSEFIAEALEQQLMQIVCRQARESSFGAWNDRDYPHLRTHDDVRRYIAEMRDKDQWRRSVERER